MGSPEVPLPLLRNGGLQPQLEFSKAEESKPATTWPGMGAEGDAEGVQGQSLLAFWELGWGEGKCCGLGELLGKSLLFAWTFFQ